MLPVKETSQQTQRKLLSAQFGNHLYSDCSVQFYLQNLGDPSPAPVLKGSSFAPRALLGDPIPAHRIILSSGSEFLGSKFDRWDEFDTVSSDAYADACCDAIGVTDQDRTGPSTKRKAKSNYEVKLMIPLDCEDELEAAVAAMRFLYSHEVSGSIRDLLRVRQQAGYLQAYGCQEACDEAIKARFCSPASGAGIDSGSPLSSIVELYACLEICPVDASFTGILHTCMIQLLKNFMCSFPCIERTGAEEDNEAEGLSKDDLLAWLEVNAVRVLNDREAHDTVMAMSADGIQALLESDGFGTDDEATVLVLVKIWLDEHKEELLELGDEGVNIRQRLCSLLRVTQINQSFLSFVVPELEWFGMSPKEALFSLEYKSASSRQQEQLNALGLYDCSKPRYAGARDAFVPKGCGLPFDWEVKQESLAAASVGESVPAVFTNDQHPLYCISGIFAHGFIWSVHVERRESGAAGVFLTCGLPESVSGLEITCAARCDADVTVSRCCHGNMEQEIAVRFTAELDTFRLGVGWGTPDALELLLKPAGTSATCPVSSSGIEASSSGTGSCSTPDAEPLAAWGAYLRDGKLRGKLWIQNGFDDSGSEQNSEQVSVADEDGEAEDIVANSNDRDDDCGVHKGSATDVEKDKDIPGGSSRSNQEVGQAIGSTFGLQAPNVGEGSEDETAATKETLFEAASSGNIELLKKLVDAGMNVDEADDDGRTALHFAAGYGDLDCLKVLVDAKAKLFAVDTKMNTALHYASGYGQAESVKLLLESGADRSAKNLDGKTALEVAQLNEQADVIVALQPKQAAPAHL